jgi:hypothetical protein
LPRWLLGIGGAALALLLIFATGILLLRGGDEPRGSSSSASDPRTTAPEPERTTSAPTPRQPADPRRVADAASGLSYERLPDWLPWRGEPVFAGVGTAGQYVVTQAQSPSGGQYIAHVFLGLVDQEIPYTGPDDLQSATEALARAVEQTPGAYPPHTVKPVSSKGFTVDGRPGWRVQIDLAFTDAEGYTATGERVDVALVDLGDLRLGGVVASIPNNRNDLLPGVDRAYQTLRIDEGGAGTAAGPTA